MRIVGRLPDPHMQITVFENDGRFPVQFEQAGLTQIYRFHKSDALPKWSLLKTYVDDDFRRAVLAEFERMRTLHQTLLHRLEPPPTDTVEGLPSII